MKGILPASICAFLLGILTTFLFSIFGFGLASTPFAMCERYLFEPTSFGSSERYSCYQRTLVELLRHDGVKGVTEALRVYGKTSEGSHLQGAFCHDLGHTLGLEAASLGIPGREILSNCRNFCSEDQLALPRDGLDLGCINGAAHQYVIRGYSTHKLEEFCNVEGVDSDVRRGCYHGIGHGMIAYKKFNVSDALAECQKFLWDKGRYECAHAVFMDPDLLSYGSNTGIPKDIASFCGRVPADFLSSCWEFSGFLTYARSKKIDQAIQSCALAPPGFYDLCVGRIGEALYLAFEGSSSNIGQMCRSIKDDASVCFASTMRFMLEGDTVEAAVDKIIRLCRYAPDVNVEDCYSDFGKLLEQSSYAKRRKELCLLVPKEYTAICGGDMYVQ